MILAALGWLRSSWIGKAAAMALAALAAIALIRRDAKQDARREDKLKDHEHADEIADRVSRADTPERLRKYDGAGWRD